MGSMELHGVTAFVGWRRRGHDGSHGVARQQVRHDGDGVMLVFMIRSDVSTTVTSVQWP